jgi:hypothetical protein
MKPYPDEATRVTVSLTSLVLERVTVAEFIVPTTTLPKAIVPGVALSEPFAPPVLLEVPVPVPPGSSGFVERPMQADDERSAKRATDAASP